MHAAADAIISHLCRRSDVGPSRPQLPRKRRFDEARPGRHLLRLVPGDGRTAVAAVDDVAVPLPSLGTSATLSLLRQMVTIFTPIFPA